MSPFRTGALALALLSLAAPARAQEAISLAEALRLAASGAPALVEADASLAAERARFAGARLRPNPELDLTVENFAGSRPLSGFDGAETTAALAWPLELGGKRRARVAAAEAGVGLGVAARDLAALDLVRAVRDAHSTAAATAARLQLAREELALADQLADTAAKLVAAGREPPLRQSRAEAERATARVAVTAAEQERRAAGLALGALLGRGASAFVVEPSALYGGATAVAGPGAPDLAAARAAAAQARARIALERTARTPDPRLSLGVRRLELEGATALVAGVSVPLPLFNRNGANIAAARAEAQRAEAAERRVAAEADARAATARGAVAAAETRLASLDREVVPVAADALDLARRGYAAGRFTLVDVLDAGRALAAARRQRIDAALDLVLARAALDRATGGGPLLGDLR